MPERSPQELASLLASLAAQTADPPRSRSRERPEPPGGFERMPAASQLAPVEPPEVVPVAPVAPAEPVTEPVLAPAEPPPRVAEGEPAPRVAESEPAPVIEVEPSPVFEGGMEAEPAPVVDAEPPAVQAERDAGPAAASPEPDPEPQPPPSALIAGNRILSSGSVKPRSRPPSARGASYRSPARRGSWGPSRRARGASPARRWIPAVRGRSAHVRPSVGLPKVGLPKVGEPKLSHRQRVVLGSVLAVLVLVMLLSAISGGGAKHTPAPVHRAAAPAPVLLPPPSNAPPTPAAAAAALGKIPHRAGNRPGPGHKRHKKHHP